MKWYLVNKYDEIIDKVDMSDVGVNGARTYFIGRKQIDTESFDKLWRVMSESEYETHFKNNLQNRQMDKMKYEWWKDEETYLDVDAPITHSKDE
tara:strand:+ start:60 stop:341 length:282 start_codon:yes stop_codon:yes gene_type:complete